MRKLLLHHKISITFNKTQELYPHFPGIMSGDNDTTDTVVV